MELKNYYMEFEKGVPKWPVCQKKELNNQENGTYIIYKPSQEVFRSEPVYFDYKEICAFQPVFALLL